MTFSIFLSKNRSAKNAPSVAKPSSGLKAVSASSTDSHATPVFRSVRSRPLSRF